MNEILDIDQAATLISTYKGVAVDFLVHVVTALAILVIGLKAAKIISRSFVKRMKRRGADPSITAFINNLIYYAAVLFVVITALGQLGIQTTSFIAALGAAGLAIGLALQGSLSNFAAGVLLIIFRPFTIGEKVDFGAGAAGIVDTIQIFSTTLFSDNGCVIIIPNSKILAGNIINYSRLPYKKIKFTLTIEIEKEAPHLESQLTDVLSAHPNIIKSKPYAIKLKNFSHKQLTFSVDAWAKNEEYEATQDTLLGQLKQVISEIKN